jgi:hypothetical protein
MSLETLKSAYTRSLLSVISRVARKVRMSVSFEATEWLCKARFRSVKSLPSCPQVIFFESNPQVDKAGLMDDATAYNRNADILD